MKKENIRFLVGVLLGVAVILISSLFIQYPVEVVCHNETSNTTYHYYGHQSVWDFILSTKKAYNTHHGTSSSQFEDWCVVGR